MDVFNEITLYNEHNIKILSQENESEIQSLCERCADYYMLIEGRFPDKSTGYEVLNELPPNKEMEDKYVLGVFKDNMHLIAVVDIVKDYKVHGEWIIGLLMIDPNERGKGLGEQIHDYIINTILNYNAHKLRIGVVEENSRAYKFWSRLGYSEVDRVNKSYGNKNQTVLVMNCYLK